MLAHILGLTNTHSSFKTLSSFCASWKTCTVWSTQSDLDVSLWSSSLTPSQYIPDHPAMADLQVWVSLLLLPVTVVMIANIYWASRVLSSLNPDQALWSRYHYYTHFTDEQTEAPDLPKVAKLVSTGTIIQTKAVFSRICTLTTKWVSEWMNE